MKAGGTGTYCGIHTVYNLMTEKVKAYKKHIAPDETTNSDDMPKTTFCESKVNLYRYGGFALQKILQAYTQTLY